MAAPQEIVPLLEIQAVADPVIGTTELEQVTLKTDLGDSLVAAKPIDKDLHKPSEFSNVSEAEEQQKKLTYPKSVFFIISNEFCERFNYYGMRTVLVLYLSRVLGHTENTATVIFHISSMLVYCLSVVGAIISDSWLGKFRTILYFSMVYICGSVLMTLGSIAPLGLPVQACTMLGLALIGLGSGGIKPCVSAFGGDQFKIPEQANQLTSFFSLFYFTINAGSLISMTLTPILREDVSCFDDLNCYPLAFGVPALLMIIAVVIFVLGRPLYKMIPPAGNMLVLVSSTIWSAWTTKCKEKKINPREHWLDYADKKYDRKLINDVKVIMRVLFLYLPLPVFFALFHQQGSRWTFQATRMDRNMGSWDIKPEQLHVLNPLLLLILIPLCGPVLRFVGLRSPLQKLTIGGILAGIAFIISGVVELNLEKTYPTLPYNQNAQLRIFNTQNCSYSFATNLAGAAQYFQVPPLSVYINKDVFLPGSFILQYNYSSLDPNCQLNVTGSQRLEHKQAWSFFINPSNATSRRGYWSKDFVNKPSDGHPLARTIANVQPQRKIVWRTEKGAVEYEANVSATNLTRLSSTYYDVLIDDQLVGSYRLHPGGVYTLLVEEKTSGGYIAQMLEVTTHNSMNILWQIPQIVVMTLAEAMFSITGLEFSYSQAPPSMKSVLQACWLLTMAFGDVIVAIIAKAKLFESQANEFFLFAGLMFVDMFIFKAMANNYVPYDPNETSGPEILSNEVTKLEIPPLLLKDTQKLGAKSNIGTDYKKIKIGIDSHLDKTLT